MENRQILFTNSTEETEKIGKTLAKELLASETIPAFLALYGDLGVGKTAFVRGFVSAVSPASLVRSPTFSLVNEYRAGKVPVYHFDLYRIEDEDDLASIGYDDYLTKKAFCLTEWSEKIPEALPACRLEVRIEKDDPRHPDHRKITIEPIGGIPS
ncbi:MAG: tRNA (adenosine(37)-N6)-threonylcarbamoyltransferase complex ATPase subunit type 1 TsaE [Clostridia bacterium]|nr:tRNA (adenosine(37)-N6)-threonylcarbamoyltransferase complex ATPase subunit type 1 TsaE [Clostridia bacterium]